MFCFILCSIYFILLHMIPHHCSETRRCSYLQVVNFLAEKITLDISSRVQRFIEHKFQYTGVVIIFDMATCS